MKTPLNPLKGTYLRAVPFRELKGVRKKMLLGFLFCFYFLRVNAQWVNIPDPNFVNWLNNNGYASCMNGSLMDTTCNLIVTEDSLSISWTMYDLAGISYFDNLLYLDCSPNNLTGLPPLPASLIYLDCSYNDLTILSTLPSRLRTLICNNNQLISISSLPDTLKYLDCGYNQLINLPLLNDSLSLLYCRSNLIGNLPSLPDNLKELICSYNQLTVLPQLPDSLQGFVCGNNQISDLPLLPDSLYYLDCGHNNLDSLPSLPNNLKYLFCYYNSLTSLPVLPTKLYNFQCGNNLLNSLPALPDSLHYLSCTENLISALPVLPDSLQHLNCSDNQIISLPILPDSLKFLSCGNNPLISLPSLPPMLHDLYCAYSQLTSLPNLPPFLYHILAFNNQFTGLPELPDSVTELKIWDNPNLLCLPEIKKIAYIDFTNTGITCIPNNGLVGVSYPPIASLPLCDTNNVNGCPVYYNIAGKIYLDSISNCIADTNETSLINLKVNLFSGATLLEQTYSKYNGFYSFKADTGTFTYSVDTAGLSVLVSCPAIGYYTSVFTPVDTTDFGMDFGMECKPGFDVGVTSMVSDSGQFRPANFAKVKIAAGDISNFYGLHCAAGTSGAVKVILSGPVTYVSAAAGSLVPVVSGDTLTYSIADFGIVNYYSDFRFVVQTDTTAMAGQICFSVNVTPAAGDLNATNNSLQHCFTVVNSYDPNNKEVFPEGDIDTSQHWLTYTINFQNTGTAPAQHIYILDTLDTDFDESTFTLLSYSHNPLTQVVGNVIRFNFPNINLPDSVSDEPNSHGYVQYKVKLKNNLPFGTVIENTAHIIFDFNAPVVTNTTMNEIINLTGLEEFDVQSILFKVFPNPVFNNELTILFQSSLKNPVTFEVSDITGRKVFSQQLPSTTKQQIIHLPELSSGLYNCVITSGSNRAFNKVAVIND